MESVRRLEGGGIKATADDCQDDTGTQPKRCVECAVPVGKGRSQISCAAEQQHCPQGEADRRAEGAGQNSSAAPNRPQSPLESRALRRIFFSSAPMK